MVTAEYFFRNGQWQGFRIGGHAGGKPRGENLVCAAVSAIVQTAIIGLTDVAGINAKVDMQDGDVQCTFAGELHGQQAENARVILETMAAGLQSVSLGSPGQIHSSKTEV